MKIDAKKTAEKRQWTAPKSDPKSLLNQHKTKSHFNHRVFFCVRFAWHLFLIVRDDLLISPSNCNLMSARVMHVCLFIRFAFVIAIWFCNYFYDKIKILFTIYIIQMAAEWDGLWNFECRFFIHQSSSASTSIS